MANKESEALAPNMRNKRVMARLKPSVPNMPSFLGNRRVYTRIRIIKELFGAEASDSEYANY
jgi:hypothetical protein